MALTLTEKAIEKLETDLESRRKTSSEVFRLLALTSGGFGMRLDEPGPGDVLLRNQDKPLLAVAPALAEHLTDTALDVGRSTDEPDWVLVRGKNP